MDVSGPAVSSPDETRFLDRNDPRSFLKRDPSFDGPGLFDDRDGERKGTVWTLVVVDTNLGVDI